MPTWIKFRGDRAWPAIFGGARMTAALLHRQTHPRGIVWSGDGSRRVKTRERLVRDCPHAAAPCGGYTA